MGYSVVVVFKRLWAWYGRVGRPISLYSEYSLENCRKRLQANALPWHKRAPLSSKAFKLELHTDNTFLLQYRRPLSHLSGRTFEGRLTTAPDGGTFINGIIRYERSFLGFLSVVTVVAPLGGATYWETRGLVIGLIIGLLLFAAALFVRFTEERSPLWKTFYTWLRETLDAQEATSPAALPPGE